jgi:hypothetical protein
MLELNTPKSVVFKGPLKEHTFDYYTETKVQKKKEKKNFL